MSAGSLMQIKPVPEQEKSLLGIPP